MSSKSPRRKRNNWTNEEVNLLKDCVLKYGRKWSLLEKNFPLFKKNNRTQIDLKDKWRNILINDKTQTRLRILRTLRKGAY